VFVVARTDKLRVVVAVPELEAAFVDVGDAVEIRLQALPGMVVSGVVARTAGSLDEASRTLRVEIDLDNQPSAELSGSGAPRLRPGLYATTTITSEAHADVITVPKGAIVRDGAGPATCFVLDADTVRRREVTTGLEENGLVEVITGLDGSERVIVSGAAALTDGQRVKTP
jgi:RND family efflux transporter MFP subunit